ncbi:MAG: hypothetical protein ACRD2W_20600 [Acidimicrobiales bacterium]
MPRKIEWRFTEDTMLSVGHWYEAYGDPANEALLTLTQVIRMTDNPVWCLHEHTKVLRKVVGAANDLLTSLDEAMPTDPGDDNSIDVTTPIGTSILRAHQALQHVAMLLVDALVECRKGRMDAAFRVDPGLCTEVIYGLSDAINTQAWLAHRVRYPIDED